MLDVIVAHRMALWRIKEAVEEGRMVEIDVMAYDDGSRNEL
jgi:hypothetical protein